MKKRYLILSLLTVAMITSCGNSDTTAEDTSGEHEQATSVTNDSASDASAAAVVEAYAKDKSSISTADIDPADTSFTMRAKTLYVSDENGKKITVVYGYKKQPNGIAIIELEGEKPIKLNQVETPPGVQYEFTNGTITLKRVDKGIELNENGEVVAYKEIL
ncbi:hypothetical protein ACTJIJ_23415 [Niabella sp. 22666]|uniref:hypothetical protein n=1 Tax=Niabella sp. 22666 TaxID=3453954 RepID=UPI003F827071